MDDKQFREQGPPTTLDNTMRTTLRSCARKLYWFLRGADYEFTPPYFVFGRVWQIVMDSWYIPQTSRDMSPAEINRHRDRALAVGRKEWNNAGVLGARNDTWENLEALFKFYVQTYPYEPFKVIGVEKGWEWPIAGTPYLLGGSLDDYIEWEPFGELIFENKTSGVYLADSYIAQWDHSSQITQYIWYLTQLLGKEIFGCQMNMACKRIAKGKAEEARMTGIPPDGLFARDLQKRSPWALEKFIEEVLLDIADIEREWERWVWPKTCDHIQCAGGIGKSPCLFRPLCLAEIDPWDLDPTTYEGIIWREGPWEPWRRS